MPDASKPALCNTLIRAACAAVTSLAFTVVVELNPATYFAGSCPASCASSSSVSGVMLAVAVLPIDPEPATSECSTVLPSLLVTVTTQGRLAPVMGAE
jgi:hypothetical protein